MNSLLMTETARAADALSVADELLPIREVVRATGVNPVTLRAWERRYGLIQPTRTESGHRLYSMADVEAVRSILAWTERGVAVSKVGSLLARSNAGPASEAPTPAEVCSGDWAEWQLQLRNAVAEFDEARLDQLYGQIFSTYPLAIVYQDVLLPVWQELMLRQDEFGRTSEWLFLDAFLRARVLQRLQLGRLPGRERVLVAAVAGQCRELELLIAGLLLGNDSLAVSVLPFGQPMDELALVCDKVQPQALVLFSNLPPGEPQVRQFGKVALAVNCPVALAGEAAEHGRDALRGTSIACLGSTASLMQRRLMQFLAGQLDT